ncbi:MAG: hypothetical protein WC333_01060 [Dehalococcoidia bacterium]|jgi:hypothetical protein
MSEELLSNEAREAEIRKAEEEKVAKINASLNNIQNKTSKFIFCVPESQSPAASIYEIYFHATVVKKMGYTVLVMVEKGDYVPPTWIEKELTDHKHMSMADPKLNVGPEDIMVIPEVYSNIMEQTKNLPCLRVGLLQSVDYMINSLVPGSDWRTFGITEMITTSTTLKNFVEGYYGVGKFNIKTYNIGIPDYFEKSTIPQKPIISVIGRNPNEIAKFVKLFFSKFPQYSWVTFDPMLTKSKPPQSMRRMDFAKRLQGNFAAVWIDRIASFGTFPLECMKCGTIPVCLKPDLIPDYMITRDAEGKPLGVNDGAGVWTDNYYDLPLLAGEVLIKFLDDSILPALYESMDTVAEKYTQKNAEAELNGIYQNYIDQRITFLQHAIAPQPQPVVEQK